MKPSKITIPAAKHGRKPNLRRPQSRPREALATKHDLEEMECRIMSAISEYHAELKESLDGINTDVDTLVTAVTGPNGLQEDSAHLLEIISKIGTNPGPISPEDQALLTEGKTIAAALKTKTKAIADAATALAAATDSSKLPEPPPA